jgi:hypothetical protein
MTHNSKHSTASLPGGLGTTTKVTAHCGYVFQGKDRAPFMALRLHKRTCTKCANIGVQTIHTTETTNATK